MKNWITDKGTQIRIILEGRANTYLVSKGNKHLLIDPGREKDWPQLVEKLDSLIVGRNSLEAMILTHVHYDHVENAARIKEKYKTNIIVHRSEAERLSNGDNSLVRGTMFLTRYLSDLLWEKIKPRLKYDPVDGDTLVDEQFDLATIGFNAYIMHTPGHTEGSISIIIDNQIALVGDAMFGIFKGSVYPPLGQDPKVMVNSWQKLLDTGCTLFLPGHGRANSRELVLKQYDKFKKKQEKK